MAIDRVDSKRIFLFVGVPRTREHSSEICLHHEWTSSDSEQNHDSLKFMRTMEAVIQYIYRLRNYRGVKDC